MRHKGEIKAFVCFAGTWAISMIVLSLSGKSTSALAAGLESSARDSLWAIALILTTSVAIFNNSFKLFDKAEQIFKGRKDAIDQNAFNEAMSQTANLSSKVMSNAFFSIVLGVGMYIMTFLRKIPTSVIPHYELNSLHLDRVAISIEVSIAVLIVYTFINQMKTVPLFVELYKLLSIQSVTDAPKKPEHSPSKPG